MFCYRRFGHNEGDEPGFTQPLMYKSIAGHPTTREIYAKRLVAEGVLKEDEPDAIVRRFHQHLEEEFEAGASYKPNKADWLGGAWSGMTIAKGDERRGTTAVKEAFLKAVGLSLARVPSGLNTHSMIDRPLQAKEKAIMAAPGLDWAPRE